MNTKEELGGYLGKLLHPLLPIVEKNLAKGFTIGHSSNYSDAATRCESFSRLLWSLAPAVAGGISLDNTERWLNVCRDILTQATDPKHSDYWGVSRIDGLPDQRYVEMCAIAYSFLIAAPEFWCQLEPHVQQNIFAWMNQINYQDEIVADNNWRFFRIFVNTFFQKFGGPFHAQRYRQDVESIDNMYLDSGWYSDGCTDFHSNQRDYYIPMAMHYYGLLHSVLLQGEDKYIRRGRKFAPYFLAWFDREGAAMPFGRSLTYRFAQAAFWSAFILAGCCSEDGINLAEAKGMLLRHLRYWLQTEQEKPIFDNGGVLRVGYTYPNLYMSESYNAVGSPYWAQKVFVILLLPSKHPFWVVEEAPLPQHKEHNIQEHARMLFLRSADGHTKCLNAGQWAGFDPNHNREKYAKFSYSALFGFNVSIQPEGLERFAADAMLSLSRDGLLWVHRGATTAHQVQSSGVASSYEPMPGVEIRTLLYPVDFTWHLRIHRLQTTGELHFAEGGHSLPYDFRQEPALWGLVEQENLAEVKSTFQDKALFSSVCLLNYPAAGRILRCAPNMNLLSPHSCIPVVCGKLQAGVHLLISLCGGDRDENYAQHKPFYELQDDRVLVKTEQWSVCLALTDWGLA